nr:MAG TPA: hypothetical protein [Caudoviricetes sp.]
MVLAYAVCNVVRKGPNSFELGPSSLYIIYNTYYILLYILLY